MPSISTIGRVCYRSRSRLSLSALVWGGIFPSRVQYEPFPPLIFSFSQFLVIATITSVWLSLPELILIPFVSEAGLAISSVSQAAS